MIHEIINEQYRITRRLHEDVLSVWYEARNNADNTPIMIQALKWHTAVYRTHDFIRFKKDAIEASRLHHPNISVIIDVVEMNGNIYIITEHIPGAPLAVWMQENRQRNVDLSTVLNMMRQLIDGIHHAHRANIMHGLINPFQVFVCRDPHSTINESAVIKLAGFGISSILESIMQEQRRQEGDWTDIFSYLSLEQIKNSSTMIDERCDLYSTGALFYLLMCGRPAFSGENVHKIVHQVMTRIPDPPSTYNPAIAAVMDTLILKLLSKNPADRYQSARGLLNDLDKLISGETKFTPGQDDRIVQFSYRTKLISRSNELSLLQKFFEQARGGRGSLCFICGDSGIGKTRLAREFEQQIPFGQGLFLTGRCFSRGNKVPYGPFLEAIEQYITIFSVRLSAEKVRIKNALKKALGDLGGILLEISPGLAELFDEQKPLVRIAPDREKKRFLLTLVNFFYKLSELEGGLILFIDDIQWIDEGSLDLANEIAEGIKKHPLLILGTCRDAEVPYYHGLRRLMGAGMEGKIESTVLRLAPFDSADLSLLIAALLHRQQSDESVTGLTKIITGKCGGNPLFCIEYIKNLVSEKSLSYDDNNMLTIDHKIIESGQVPETIADVLLKRIPRLDEEEIELLSYAAILGRTFDLSLLFLLYNEQADNGGGCVKKTNEDIARIVSKAVLLNLLEQPDAGKQVFAFCHDAIRDSFYAAVDSATKKKLHTHIALALESLHRDELTRSIIDTPALFDLAYHSIEADDGERAFRYSYHAGQCAMKKYASYDAINYFSTALSFLEKNHGKTAASEEQQYRQTINRMLADIYLTIGRYEDSITLYQQLLADTPDAIGKAALYKGIAEAYYKKGDLHQCEENAQIGLKLLGERLPLSKRGTLFLLLRDAVISFTWIIPFRHFLRRSARSSDRGKLIIAFYYSLCWSYAQHDSLKFLRSVLRARNLSETRLGESVELAMSLSFYAILLTNLGFHDAALRCHHRSIALRTRFNDRWGLALSHQLMGYSYFFMGLLDEALGSFMASIDIFQEIGDLKELENSLIGKMWVFIIRGETGNRKECIDRLFEISQTIQDAYSIAYANFSMGAYCHEIGDIPAARQYFQLACDLAKKDGFWNVYCLAAIETGRLLVPIDVDEAVRWLTEIRDIFEVKRLMTGELSHLYVELADAYIAKLLTNPSFSKKQQKEYLKKIKQACVSAMTKNKTMLNCGNAYRVMARYSSLIGKNRAAIDFFKMSIAAHTRAHCKAELARTMVDFGHHLKLTGNLHQAREQLLESYRLYMEMGYQPFIDRVGALLNIKDEPLNATAPGLYKQITDQGKISSIVELMKKVNSEENIEKILKLAISLCVELIGAEHGSIIVTDEQGDFSTIAASTSNNQGSGVPSPKYRLCKLAIESQKTVLSDADHPLDSARALPSPVDEHVLCIPIVYQNTVLGVGYFYNSLPGGIFKPEDADAVELLLNAIAIRLNIFFMQVRSSKMAQKEPDAAFCTSYQITKREKEIITFLMQGGTRNEICKRLGISEGTIQTHMNNIFTKTGVNSKVDLLDLVRNSQQ